MASAPPCAAVVAIMVAVAAGCVSRFPTLDAIDEAATMKALTTSQFMSVTTLAWARFACAFIMILSQVGNRRHAAAVGQNQPAFKYKTLMVVGAVCALGNHDPVAGREQVSRSSSGGKRQP